MKIFYKLCAVVCTALLLAPLTACSTGTQRDASLTDQTSADSSKQTQIVGKVISVVGNQVTLAIGTLNRHSGSTDSKQMTGREKEKSADSDTDSTNSQSVTEKSPDSSDALKSDDSDSSSSLIDLTGETQTILIPVGLSLSTGKQGGGTPNGSEDAGKEPSTAGGGTFGKQERTSAGKNSGFSGANEMVQNSERTQDFSSIAQDMILQITETTKSDGTQAVVSVTVLSA